MGNPCRAHIVKHALCNLCDDASVRGITPAVFRDRRALSEVCWTFHTIVAEFRAAYVVVHSGRELVPLLQRLSSPTTGAEGKRWGETTQRVDLKVTGNYETGQIAGLLEQTPNLLALIYDNNHVSSQMGRLPRRVLKILSKTPDLRRIDFGGIGEPPSLQNLATIARYCPVLESLQLQCTRNFPTDPAALAAAPVLTFPCLQFLSLISIPLLMTNTPGPRCLTSWGPLLSILSRKSNQLPRLRGVHVEGVLSGSRMEFFMVHGQKLRTFQASTHCPDLSRVVACCSSLETLTLLQDPILQPKWGILPHHVPNVRRILVKNPKEPAFRHAALSTSPIVLGDPLQVIFDQILGTGFDCLSEVRVYELDCYCVPPNNSLLQPYPAHFKAKGVDLVGKVGKPWRLSDIWDPVIIEMVVG